MIQQLNFNLKCEQDDHKDEIESVCYNQYCTEFRLNCFQCLNKCNIHRGHREENKKINTLMNFNDSQNIECDKLINTLNTYVDSLNKSFTLYKMGIRNKYSLQKEKLVKLNSLQINDYLNSTVKLIEYKQSITEILQEPIKKLTDSFKNLYQQLQLSQFNYYQIDDNSIKLSKELYDKGYDLYWKQKYDKAIQLFDESILQNQNNYQSLWCKGASLRFLNKYEDAIIQLDKALAIEPRHLGSLFEKALAIDPKHIGSLFDKGTCLRKLNQYEDAINWLEKVLAIEPKHCNSLSEKGQCLRLLKKYNESLELLDQALSINSQHTFSLNRKGDCLRDTQQYKEALIYYEKSLKIEPNNQYTITQKQFCQKRQNK
ncbi:unnamed protein product [Paramecium primaurelia]|uniref:Tetratricopeptide repeat protein n=1 Tax=Paramecium primaurelia TaxID=5886 RepID=A0A8S1NSG6_PARPR|nr:unnamed protein product [Paramecium primaurelia]